MANSNLSDTERSVIERRCEGLLHRVLVGADHDLERFFSAFADDVVWVRPVGTMNGKGEMRAFMEGNQKKLREENPNGHLTRHLLSSFDIDVIDDENAQSTAYAQVYRDEKFDGALPVKMNEPELVVEYRSRYRKTADGWRIARHQAIWVFKR